AGYLARIEDSAMGGFLKKFFQYTRRTFISISWMINFDKQKYLLIIIFNLMNNFKIYLAVLVMVLVIPACKKREQKRVLPPNEYFSWQDDASIPRKKRIVIFSSNGGGAHTAAASALKKYLGNEFDIQ